MNTCTSCGARLSPADLACPFCKTVTAAGAARHADEARQRQADAHAHAQYAAHQAHQQRLAAGADATAGAKRALFWSILGVVFCCIPVPAVVATVLALRARAAAKAHGLPVPGQAVAALSLSGVSAVLCVSVLVFGVVDSRRMTREKDALRATIQAHAAAATLDQPTACAMIHLHLLEHGHAGKGGNVVEAFDCAGALTQSGDRASVDDVRFELGGAHPPRVVAGCLKRGARWLVDDVRDDRRCPGDAPSAASAVAPAPPAAPVRPASTRRDAGP